jgi:hypothetical protein
MIIEKDNSILEGVFDGPKMIGTKTLTNGVIYKGNFFNGKIIGHGFLSMSFLEYEGTFENE